MKIMRMTLVFTGLLLSALVIAPVLAATHKPSEMTCDQFLALDNVVKPKVVYWSEGLTKQGDPMDAVIDIEDTDQLIPTLVTECTETPKVSFWEKIKQHFEPDRKSAGT